jgi:hypothetical protein
MVTKTTSLLNTKRSHKTVSPFFYRSPPERRGGQDAKIQRNSSRNSFRQVLCVFATLQPAPQNCGSATTDFFSRKGAEAQRNYGLLGMTSGGLCGLASLRDLLFFILAKTQSLPIGRPTYPPRQTGAKKDKALKNFLHWENVIFCSRVGLYHQNTRGVIRKKVI